MSGFLLPQGSRKSSIKLQHTDRKKGDKSQVLRPGNTINSGVYTDVSDIMKNELFFREILYVGYSGIFDFGIEIFK